MITNYIFYRGNTVLDSLSKTNISPKTDLCLSASLASLDYSLIEFAKEFTSRKYYLDKPKLILVSKQHLNILIKNLQSKQTDLHIPFMQIMGFDCHLLHLVLVKPKQYILVNVVIFLYPVIKSQINKSGIEQLINFLSYIKVVSCLYYSRYSQPDYLYLIIGVCFGVEDSGRNFQS